MYGLYSNLTIAGAGTFVGTASTPGDASNCVNHAASTYTAVYNEISTTVATAAPVIGGGTILTPGCFFQNAAINTAASTNITLDAQGDPKALFVIAGNGAFSLGASSYVLLRNGAKSENIFWIINGAVNLGANSILQGNVLLTGALTLGADSKLCGRGLPFLGALSMGVGTSIIVDDCDV
jgi:hypothetical protein